ncbi:MAG: tetratricopeptide repeat protein [Aquaticitalea sp.]
MKDHNNITQDFLETIERFYNGSMPTEERKVIEARLQQDAKFKTRVEDVKILLFGIEEQALKERLDEFHKELPIKKETKKSDSKVRHFNFRNIAAAIVIVMVSATFWLINNPSNERLYDSYFKPDPGLPTTMSSSDNFAFFDAMVNYKQGDYEKAINKWQILQKKAPDNDTINYFLGVAHLANKSENKAIPFLKEVTNSNHKAFKDDAHYYLGLAYLKEKNFKEAKKNLGMSSIHEAKTVLSKIKD